ncbi:MAG TPA: siphovirus Gp157 family protein [Bryobacteraceae bacterium]|nr:siphovirus Gp157 family protein [Bryobacteraceae bacterium]
MPAGDISIIPAKSTVPTLYEIEDSLQALIETGDSVTPEMEDAFQAELSAALHTAASKRDRVAQFLAFCDSQKALAKQEIDRIRKRQAAFEKAAERLESYVVAVIKSLGADEKGRYRKLEGNSATLSIKRNPASTSIEDDSLIPLRFKDASVTARCPADRWVAAVEEISAAWSGMLETMQFSDDAKQLMSLLLDGRNVTYSTRKADVKKAIESGEDVPGADLDIDNYSLVVR